MKDLVTWRFLIANMNDGIFFPPIISNAQFKLSLSTGI